MVVVILIEIVFGTQKYSYYCFRIQTRQYSIVKILSLPNTTVFQTFLLYLISPRQPCCFCSMYLVVFFSKDKNLFNAIIVRTKRRFNAVWIRVRLVRKVNEIHVCRIVKNSWKILKKNQHNRENRVKNVSIRARIARVGNENVSEKRKTTFQNGLL